jgi:hypothetical protein
MPRSLLMSFNYLENYTTYGINVLVIICFCGFLYNFSSNYFFRSDKYSYLASYGRDTNVGLRVKYTLFLSDFNHNWNILENCLKTLQYQMLLKSV